MKDLELKVQQMMTTQRNCQLEDYRAKIAELEARVDETNKKLELQAVNITNFEENNAVLDRKMKDERKGQQA